MPRKLSLMLTLFFAGVLAGACAEESGADDHEEHEEECSDTQLMRAQLVLEEVPDEVAGSEIYLDTCAESFCHGADGDSGPAPPLSEEVQEYEQLELACILLTGPGEMPSLATLSDQELADVLAYVRTNF